MSEQENNPSFSAKAIKLGACRTGTRMIAAAFTHSCCLIREDFEEQCGKGKEVPVAFEMGAYDPALALIEGSKGGGGGREFKSL